MPQVKIVANNFMDMVASLPSMKLDRLFQKAFICEAILRSLPPLAKKYVMHLLYLDVPVPGNSLEDWVLASGVSKHKVAIDRLTQLRVFGETFDRKREVSFRLKYPTFQSNIQKHIRLGSGGTSACVWEGGSVRLLQRNKYPELALHLRLELLEGVVAYHTGQIEKSRAALSAAQMKYLRLEVSDEALVSLMNMGYKESDAKRALRMTNQDVESAVGFLIDEINRKSEERKKDRHRRKEILEQKKYGVTPLRKAVDLQKLNELVFVGYEKALAAEVLRRNENDVEKSLDDLTDPTTNAAIQAELELKKAKRFRRTDEAIEAMTRMGFTRAAVEEALQRFGTKEKALNYLLGSDENGAQTAVEGGAGDPANDAASSSAVAGGAEDAAELQADVAAHDATLAAELQRDAEMEDEITAELYNRDPLSDYEIDVAKEGEAINEYLALISSAQN